MKKLLLLVASLTITVAMPVRAQQDTEDEKEMDDVVITGTRMATTSRNMPYNVSIVSRRTLVEQDRPNVLPTLSEQVPSLFVTQRGMMGYGVSGGAAGGITMRGISSTSGQLLVLIDGHPQYQGVFGHSISDSYLTMLAERVEVLRNPASVLYGSNAMGGVVNIITRQMKEDGVKTHLSLGAGSYGTIQAEASNQVRAGRFSSTIAGQYGRSDNQMPRMGFEQYGGLVKLTYDINEHWNTFVDANITHFNASQPGTTSAPLYEADQWITRGATTLAVENNYHNTNGRISVYDNFGIHKINDGYKEGAKPQTEFFRSKDALAGVSAYQSIHMKGSRATIGMDYQHIYGRAYYTSRETGEIVTSGRRGMQSCHTHMNEVAVYIDASQDLTNWLSLNAGVRYDHHSVAGDEWIPQTGIIGRIKNLCGRNGGPAEVKLNVTKGFRNPTTKDMFLYGTANDSLRAERLWDFEIAWKHHVLDGKLTYGINLFYIKGDNMIQTVGGKNINTGEIKNKGAEIEATWHINNHWTLSTNHSFLNMKHHVIASPEYKGYIGANMRYGKWSATAGLQQLHGLFTEVGAKETKQEVTLLNASVAYQVLPQLRLWVKGDNLLAQKYEINAGYPMPKATFMAGVNVNF